MFFNNSRKIALLEQQVDLLERKLALVSDFQDLQNKVIGDVIETLCRTLEGQTKLDLEQKAFFADYLLHKTQKYHVVKDGNGKFQPDRIELSAERELALMQSLTKALDALESANKLNPST